MKDKCKRFFCLLLTAVMLVALLPTFALAAVYDSGRCGSNVTWQPDASILENPNGSFASGSLTDDLQWSLSTDYVLTIHFLCILSLAGLMALEPSETAEKV